jgi:hypothetical protein
MNAHAARGAITVFVAVLGWALVYFLFAHAWTLLTANESVVSQGGFVVREIVRIAPTLIYFLAAGLIVGYVFGRAMGARWAALAAAIAMIIEAMLERYTFFQGIDSFAVLLLAVNYILPIVVAAGGALIAGVLQRPDGGTIAT